MLLEHFGVRLSDLSLMGRKDKLLRDCQVTIFELRRKGRRYYYPVEKEGDLIAFLEGKLGKR